MDKTLVIEKLQNCIDKMSGVKGGGTNSNSKNLQTFIDSANPEFFSGPGSYKNDGKKIAKVRHDDLTRLFSFDYYV